MILKFSFKLFFLKCIFEFMINVAPQGSSSFCGREKYFKAFHCVGGSWGADSNPGEVLPFFFLSLYFHPLACFRLLSLLTLFSFARFLR